VRSKEVRDEDSGRDIRALLVTVAPALAADPCPPELPSVREALKAAGATAKATKPTSLAGQRKDVQAPRGQDIQAPGGQDIQAPRAQARAHAASREAIRQAEQACKAGDMTKSDKAREALRLPRGREALILR